MDGDGEWTQSELEEFAAFLSDSGIDVPLEVLQFVPDGVTLMDFARKYAELDSRGPRLPMRRRVARSLLPACRVCGPSASLVWQRGRCNAGTVAPMEPCGFR